MAFSSVALVGRGAELAALDDCLATVARRNYAAVELVGEPGIGKTRLLTELEAKADRQGFLVLAGSASELEDDLPFGVFVDALDEYLHALEPRRLGGLPPELGQVSRRSRTTAIMTSATACTGRCGSCSRRWRLRSTGPFAGIEPTGRAVEIGVIDIVRVADGRIVEHWNCVDRLGLVAQLSPEAAASSDAPATALSGA